MCTASVSIQAKVEKLIALNVAMSNLKSEAESIEAEIKNYMLSEEADIMLAGSHTVSYKPIMNKRIDTKALKALLGEEALEPYYIVSETRRFQVK